MLAANGRDHSGRRTLIMRGWWPCQADTGRWIEPPSRWATHRTTLNSNQVRLRLPPEATRTVGPPRGAATLLKQSREAHLAARPLHPEGGLHSQWPDRRRGEGRLGLG